MSDSVVSASGLGKSYLISHKTAQTGTFRDRIVDSVAGIRRNIGRTLSGQQLLTGDDIEEFWALRDVDFSIKHGEAVGIIGRNGAGKSTLLKVLSRITEPTTGRVEIRGRVASLLEVGTGFHPELTGRENIFLNGAILGMTRAEIRRRFDEIVDFAGVEKFLDTPVKRYSSGMYIRLAFAVAAHLEPEILIVDEVLAVGDAEFQKKCLGKMQDVAGEGRAVLFVSHNIAAVRALCSRGIYMASGKVRSDGDIESISSAYLADAWSKRVQSELPSDPDELSVKCIRLNGNDGFMHEVNPERPMEIQIVYEAHRKQSAVRFVLTFRRPNGEIAFCTTDQMARSDTSDDVGVHSATARIPEDLLNSGWYQIDLRLGRPGVSVIIPDKTILEIFVQSQRASGSTTPEAWPGSVAPKVVWDLKTIRSE